HLSRAKRGVDRVVEVLGAADRVLGDGQLVPVRRPDVAARRTPPALVANEHGHLGPSVGQLGKARTETLAVRDTWGVVANRFVVWLGDVAMYVGVDSPSNAFMFRFVIVR